MINTISKLYSKAEFISSVSTTVDFQNILSFLRVQIKAVK